MGAVASKTVVGGLVQRAEAPDAPVAEQASVVEREPRVRTAEGRLGDVVHQERRPRAADDVAGGRARGLVHVYDGAGRQLELCDARDVAERTPGRGGELRDEVDADGIGAGVKEVVEPMDEVMEHQVADGEL